MKVLIGVDDSAHAETTLAFVRAMSWPANTEFVVASAVPPPFVPYSESYAPVAVDVGVWLKDLTQLHECLATRGARRLADAGLHTQARVLEGDPREALLEETKKENADLVVVGSHGRTGLEKLLMGSVATHVVTHAPCSVLVVKRRVQGGRGQPA